MILVDTSIWIDHLHATEPRLVAEMAAGQVVTHALVIAELSLGHIKNRSRFLAELSGLPLLATATHSDVLALVDRHRLHGLGLSAVDGHLLASLALAPGLRLWTRDKALRRSAVRLGMPVT
ncbi:MAG: type II toxin-antitoxin system VapC family toxin [Nocardioides sp.]